MSSSSTPEIDPRFDPRFQRGYSGEGQAAPVSEPDEPALFRSPIRDTGGSRDGMMPSTDSVPHVEDPPVTDAAPPPASEPNAPDPGVEVEYPGTPLRIWFVAAWILAAAAILLGTGLIWAGNSDTGFYTGTSSNDVLRNLSWIVGPSLLRFGLIAAVGVTTWAGVRQATRHEAGIARESAASVDAPPADLLEPTRLLPRVPAVYALAGTALAIALLLVWTLPVALDQSVYQVGPSADDDALRRIALAQTLTALAPPLLEAGLVASLGLIVVGAGAAAARRRLSRARRPAR